MLTSELPQIKNLYNYSAYKDLLLNWAENKETSGEQTAEHIEATHMNAHRMKRIDKQVELCEDLKIVLSGMNKKLNWLLITEAWCGDSAQSTSVLAKMATYKNHIDLKLIFRDENPDFMNAFLTNGNKAIPKLICFDEENKKLIGTWGPRPAAIQKMAIEYKKNNPGVSHEEFVTNLHLWYARDKTNALQQEFILLLREWNLANISK